MVRLKLSLELNYDIGEHGGDFIFNIHAAHTPCQVIVEERLELSQPLPAEVHTDPSTGNRYLCMKADAGPLKVGYRTTVDITHHFAPAGQIPEVPVARMPPEVYRYIYPSRYCQSDRLHKLAIREFGHIWQGYSRVQMIRDWVNQRVTFTPNTSDSNTSAVDTLISQVGVCRDYAHLMIALCRAVNIPARFTTGIDYGADPALGPTDFHAYVEAFLGDRWYMFDPSGTAIPMGFVRFGTGRDAADVSFATIFGSIKSQAPLIHIEAIADPRQNYFMPFHCVEGISTDAGDAARHPQGV